jgi:hypothetical protein
VRESYIGLLPISEYLKIIMDDDGNVRRRLFFDNIRDFQGDTTVNKSIAGTLLSETSIEFPLRNNGVTIVTRKLQGFSDRQRLPDQPCDRRQLGGGESRDHDPHQDHFH